MKATIELNFYYYSDEKYINKFKLSFYKESKPIDSNVCKDDIPEELFMHNRDKIVIGITLFTIENDSKEFKFYAYKGENKVYIKIDALDKNVFEIIFKVGNDLQIKRLKQNFTKFDSLGNKDRVRLTLINPESYININKNLVDLNDIVNNNINVNEKLLDSFQISVENLKEKQYIVRQLKEDEETDIIFLKQTKEELKNFISNLNKLLEEKDEIIFEYNFGLLKKQYKCIFSHKPLNLNINKDYLNQYLKDNNLQELDIFSNLFILDYFINNRDKSFNKKQLEHIIPLIQEKKKEINALTNVDFIEKIRILDIFCNLLEKFDSIENINSLGIKYFIFADRENNSIMDKVYNFFQDFINSLSEKSKIFSYLLSIDSGFGFHKKKKVYTFDLTSLSMIKSHLNDLFPKSCIFYKKDNDNIALTSCKCGGIAINEIYVLPEKKKNENINYNLLNNNLTTEECEDISMNIVLFLFHEYMGHKKFALASKGKESPKKVFNKQSKLIELKYKNEFKENDYDSEYILTSNLPKGDSGHFLELCFGKFENELIFHILANLKNKGKLIYRADLFTDSGEKLKKYTILKKKAEKKGLTFNFTKEQSIENEIDEMEKKLFEFEYKDPQKRNRDKKADYPEDENNSKKKKIDANFLKSGEKSETQVKIDKDKEELFTGVENKISNELNENKKGKTIGSNEDLIGNNEVPKDKRNISRKEREKRILKKFNLNDDDNLLENIEAIFDDKILNEEDLDDLLFLYSKYNIKY